MNTQQAIAALLAGEDGGFVKARLEEHYKGTGDHHMYKSLSNKMSVVRSAVLNAVVLDEGLLAPLRESTNPEVVAFLAATSAEKYRIQKRHAESPTWSVAEEACLARLPLLPSNMASFVMTKEETKELKRGHKRSRDLKNETLIKVSDGNGMVKRLWELLAASRPTDSFGRLVIPLLLCTGRRMTEILNGRSFFTPCTDDVFYAMFKGQIKQRNAQLEYRIPLLAPHHLFQHTFQCLRSKQMGVEELTNEEVNKRYAGSLRSYLSKLLPSLFPMIPSSIHPHDFRSIYINTVYELFDSPYTFSRTCQTVLGHKDMDESLSYSNVRVEGVQGHPFGPLVF